MTQIIESKVDPNVGKTDMDNYQSKDAIQRIYDQDNLLDILIEFEAVLDSLDLYTFKNWFEGEIASGPWLRRYWIEVTLKYKHEEMPDPSGGLRLLKHGARVSYELAEETMPVEIESPEDIDQQTQKAKTEEVKIWLIHVKIPRRFIEDMETGIIHLDDQEEEEIDLTAAQTGEEEGVGAEDSAQQVPTEEDEDMEDDEFNTQA